jgi:phage/plasmid-like protein (TIGR03299 family)
MAHMIDTSNNRANIAYVGETPWHGLGANLPAGQPVEVWQKEAGLDWIAQQTAVLFQDDQGINTAADHTVIYRSDTRKALGVVSDGYKVVQPKGVIEFFRELTEKFNYTLETAGCLKEGRVAWALARTGDNIRVGGTDVVGGFLLLSTSFDGSRATEAKFTTVRVVCNNTLRLSDKDAPQVRVSHRSVFDEIAAKRELAVGAFHRFEEQANALAETKVSPEQQVDFLLQVYHGVTAKDVAAGTAQLAVQTEKTMNRLAAILANAPGQQLRSTLGTAWGLVNAVTHDVDFQKPARSQDNRLVSSWFGQGDAVKARAWNQALALAA